MAFIGQIFVDYLTSKRSSVWKLNKNMSYSTIKTLMNRGYIFRESSTKRQFVIGADGLLHFTDDAILFNDTVFIGDVPKTTTSSGTTDTTNVTNPIYQDCDALLWSGKILESGQCKLDNWKIWNQLNIDAPINETIVEPFDQWVKDSQKNIDQFVKDSQTNLDYIGAGIDQFVKDSQTNIDNAMKFGDDIKKYTLIAGAGIIGVYIFYKVKK